MSKKKRMTFKQERRPTKREGRHPTKREDVQLREKDIQQRDNDVQPREEDIQRRKMSNQDRIRHCMCIDDIIMNIYMIVYAKINTSTYMILFWD